MFDYVWNERKKKYWCLIVANIEVQFDNFSRTKIKNIFIEFKKKKNTNVGWPLCGMG